MIGYLLPGAGPVYMIVCTDCKKIHLASGYRSSDWKCQNCESNKYLIINYNQYNKRIGSFMSDAELLTILVQKSG